MAPQQNPADPSIEAIVFATTAHETLTRAARSSYTALSTVRWRTFSEAAQRFEALRYLHHPEGTPAESRRRRATTRNQLWPTGRADEPRWNYSVEFGQVEGRDECVRLSITAAPQVWYDPVVTPEALRVPIALIVGMARAGLYPQRVLERKERLIAAGADSEAIGWEELVEDDAGEHRRPGRPWRPDELLRRVAQEYGRALKGGRASPVKEAQAAMSELLGYPVPRDTMNKWMKAARDRGFILTPPTRTGRRLGAPPDAPA